MLLGACSSKQCVSEMAHRRDDDDDEVDEALARWVAAPAAAAAVVPPGEPVEEAAEIVGVAVSPANGVGGSNNAGVEDAVEETDAGST